MPQKLSPEQFEAIFLRIEAGETLRKILPTVAVKDDDGTEHPLSRSTFLRWINEDQPLVDRYTHAMDHRADAWAERIVDTSTDPTMASDQKRAEVDGLKWVAARANPRKYGDHLELSGELTIRDKRKTDAAVEAAAMADK